MSLGTHMALVIVALDRFWNDIAHDSDTNAASNMACIGRIGQQSNGDCGNPQERRRSLMARGCVPVEGIHPPPARA